MSNPSVPIVCQLGLGFGGGVSDPTRGVLGILYENADLTLIVLAGGNTTGLPSSPI